MDLFEAIEKRASVRAYVSVEIPEEDLLKIADAGRRAPSGGNRQPLQFILIRQKDTLKALEKVQACVATASAAIGIVADPAVSRWWLEDASAAAENMLLAIQALGYASVWVEGTLLKQEDFAKKLLGIPPEKKFVILLPVGKAPQDTPQADRKPLQDIIWREHYGKK
ncbi:MAG: nitroreductase family protein [Planctomycetota bacterium]|jgi:nitroreductase|nr:nitroreductase family protein [Planctomycetota bacterium]